MEFANKEYLFLLLLMIPADDTLCHLVSDV